MRAYFILLSLPVRSCANSIRMFVIRFMDIVFVIFASNFARFFSLDNDNFLVVSKVSRVKPLVVEMK